MFADLWPAITIMIVLMLLNFPLYICILSCALYIAIFVTGTPLQQAFSVGFEGLSKNALVAIPFFVLAGNFIAGGTLGKRLIDCFTSLFRGVRAGLPLSCVLAQGVFGAMCGSPPAEAAVFLKLMHKSLAESEGDKTATGLILSASVFDGLIPPSVTMIIYGLVSEQSVAVLFIAGIVPGILVICLYAIYLLFRFKSKPEGKFDIKEIAQALKKGVPVIIMPVLVLGGIYGGFVTPTEAGALASAYCLILGLAMKEIKPRQIIPILRNTIMTVAQIFIIVASASFFVRMLTMSQFQHTITAGFSGFSAWQFLLMLNLLLLLIGAFFDPNSAMLILVPILLPAAIELGIDPVHFGIVIITNLLIGMFTPPFGLNIFVGQSILGYDVKYITICLAPFIVIGLVGLLIITYVPAVTLWLPNLLF